MIKFIPLRSHYGSHITECRRQQTKWTSCTYGILMSSKCGSDCILSAVCTEPGLWIALCPLRGRANQSLIPLQSGPVRVIRTIRWQQANTPADPGVRSLRNHSEPSLNRQRNYGFSSSKLQTEPKRGKCSF